MDTSAVINVNVQSNDTPQAQYKTVVLKPNMVDDVNTLTQAMLTAHGQNTKFVIKYDFTLGEDITVPDNCVLEFDGGSISENHTLTGNNTYINWNGAVIFGSDIIIAGTWNCPVISTKMFSNLSADNALRKLESLNTDDIQTSMYIEKASYDYYFLLPTNYDVGINIHSNTDVFVNGTIKCKDSAAAYEMINISQKKNISIIGSGTITGDWDVHSGGTVDSEWGHCIVINKSENVKIQGLDISKAWGDGINLGNGEDATDYGVAIENCTIHHCRRTGIGAANVVGLEIARCKINNINGTGTGMCVDIETEQFENNPYRVENVRITECTFENGGLIQITGAHNGIVKDVLVVNCYLYESTSPIQGYEAIVVANAENVQFESNNITIQYSKINTEYALTETRIINNKIKAKVNGWQYVGIYEDNDIIVDNLIGINYGVFKRNRIEVSGDNPLNGGYYYDNDIKITCTGVNQYCAIPSSEELIFVGNKITVIQPSGTNYYRFTNGSSHNIVRFDGNYIDGLEGLSEGAFLSAFINGRNIGNLWIGDGGPVLGNGKSLPYGPTTARNLVTDLVPDGFQFFDTTENKVVTKLGTGWV